MNKSYRNALIVIGIVVFGIWGLWHIIPDGRASATNGVQVSLSPDSVANVGNDQFTITLKDTTGKPIDGATVNISMNMTTMNMGEQRSQATTRGNGQYAATGRLLMGGPWRVSVTATLPNGQQVNKNFVINAQ